MHDKLDVWQTEFASASDNRDFTIFDRMRRSSIAISEIKISNPKLYKDRHENHGSRIFSYYAGFSSSFVCDLLESLDLKPESIIFDPWNGSGTTTRSAALTGHRPIGFDLNPAMVLVAKAGLISATDAIKLPKLARLAADRVCQGSIGTVADPNDPLLTWFSPSSAAVIRSLENELNFDSNLDKIQITLDEIILGNTSSTVAFLYVCLFRSIRRMLASFIPSNPTWVKKPENKNQRKRPSRNSIINAFLEEVEYLTSLEDRDNSITRQVSEHAVLRVGNAECINLENNSVDAIVASPPYCTRIDYAVSTAIELAVLGYRNEEFNKLRRNLTGTSTVASDIGEIDEAWGETCLAFLGKLRTHASKASTGYYYKNHVQYFRSLSRSIREIARVLKSSAICVLVVQDSYYKEIHNDVPSIVSEMAKNSGLSLLRREDFSTSQSMASLNHKSKRYIKSRNTNESVLCFKLAFNGK